MPGEKSMSQNGMNGNICKKNLFQGKKNLQFQTNVSLTKPPPFLYWIIGIKETHVFRGSPISPKIPMKNMGLNATLRHLRHLI